jgi:hypothetical protein
VPLTKRDQDCRQKAVRKKECVKFFVKMLADYQEHRIIQMRGGGNYRSPSTGLSKGRT